MVVCCVRSCRNGTHRTQRERPGVSFFRVPVVKDGSDQHFKQLISDRRSLWLQRINRSELYERARVCSDHFISGKPVFITDKTNVDWAPSCNLNVVTVRSTDCNNMTDSAIRTSSAETAESVSGFTMSTMTAPPAPPTKKRKISVLLTSTDTSTSTQDAATQCDIKTSTTTVDTQCFVQCCTTSQGTQTDKPALMSTGVSCRLLIEPKVTVDISSPAATATTYSSQAISSQNSDSSYQPTQSEESQSEESCSTEPIHLSPKFLVYKECLGQLFEHCPLCNHSCELSWHVIGTYVSVNQVCFNCDYKYRWASQSMVGNIPAGNISLSAAVYFTGGSFSKVDKFLKALKMAMISSATFYGHARQFLQPSILTMWRSSQLGMIHNISQRSGDVILGGDKRADSPGHCAKYGSYTVLDLRSKHIIDIQLVQSNEIGGSAHMEKEGLKRSMAFLQTSGLSVDKIITDRHPQIQKYLRENMPSVNHYYDVWHVAKGLTKKNSKP